MLLTLPPKSDLPPEKYAIEKLVFLTWEHKNET